VPVKFTASVRENTSDIEEAARLWHAIGSNDVFRLLKPNIEAHGDAAARASLREWLALYPPTDPLAALDALARRDLLLWRWLEFFNDYPLIVLPTHCDLPPPWGEDQTREGQQRLLQALRVSLIAPLLGLAGLALPVGAYGGLRTGVQIVPSRFREDLALDAGEVIEASEGTVTPIDANRSLSIHNPASRTRHRHLAADRGLHASLRMRRLVLFAPMPGSYRAAPAFRRWSRTDP
jgi:Asp-tRNA(Asn)/Glu-tRNA(Gln) amidotransferase A subunit family amidase